MRMERQTLTSVATLSMVLLINCRAIIASSKHFQIKNDNKVKEDFVYLNEKSTSVLQCAYRCERESVCTAASYNSNDGSCQLSAYRMNEPANQEKLESESSWTLMFTKDNYAVSTTEETTVSTTDDATSSSIGNTTISFIGCSEGRTKIAEACYVFIEGSYDFNFSSDSCKHMGGKLAEPKTNLTFELLRTFMVENRSGEAYWFGLRTDQSGTFVWSSDDTEPLYSGWPERQRSSQDTSGLCGRLKKDIEYRWSDNQCSRSAGVDGAVCETIPSEEDKL